MEGDPDIGKFIIAFLTVISLMLLLMWGLKKAGLASVPMRGINKKRRLKVVEHLPIDHRRRLVIVRRDDVEHLLLLSPEGDSVIETGLPAPAAEETTAEAATP